MYQYLMHRLNHSKFQQYEISNFAEKGHASTHNMTYWKTRNTMVLAPAQVAM